MPTARSRASASASRFLPHTDPSRPQALLAPSCAPLAQEVTLPIGPDGSQYQSSDLVGDLRLRSSLLRLPSRTKSSPVRIWIRSHEHHTGPRPEAPHQEVAHTTVPDLITVHPGPKSGSANRGRPHTVAFQAPRAFRGRDRGRETALSLACRCDRIPRSPSRSPSLIDQPDTSRWGRTPI